MNLLPGFLSPADYRFLKALGERTGVRFTMLPDLSETMDGVIWDDYHSLPDGGTPVAEIRAMGGAAGTVEFGMSGGLFESAAGVLERTVERMGVAPGRVRAWLGPAIGPAAFEVGDEVRAAFVAADAGAAAAVVAGAAPGKWLADLFMLARRRLEAAGVRRIDGGGVCTVADPALFYSYRRDGTTGRFVSLIWLEEGRPRGIA